MFINPWELQARLGTKRTTKSRAFRWSKFHGHARPTRRAVSESVRAVFRTSTSNFRISRVRQPLGVRSPSLAQKNNNVKSFPMVQIRWAYDTYTKSSQQKGAICISDLNFGPQAQPPQRKEAHSQSRRRRLQRALPGTTSRPTKAITTTKNHDARRRLLLHFALLRPRKTSLHGTRRGIVNYSKTRTPFERTKKRASGTLLTRH